MSVTKRRRRIVSNTAAQPSVPSVQIERIEGKMIRAVEVSPGVVVRRAVGTLIRQPLAVRGEWDDPLDTNTRSKTPRQVSGYRRADPLLLLFKRGDLVTIHHLRAAEKYRDDYEIAGGAKIGDGGTGGGGTPGGATDAQMDAMKRYRQMVQAVGQSANALLHDVLIDRIDVTTCAERRARSRHTVMGNLEAALNRLQEHYDGVPVRSFAKTA